MAEPLAGEEPMLDVRRREFMTLFGDAAATWPLTRRWRSSRQYLSLGSSGDKRLSSL
jgi:hypothetical protein